MTTGRETREQAWYSAACMTTFSIPARPRLRAPEQYVRAARNILTVVSLILLPALWWVIVTDPGNGADARGYWEAWQGGLYDLPWHSSQAFVYTPPVGIALAPFTLLPWTAFFGLLTATGMVALVYLVGLPLSGLVLVLFFPAYHDLAVGNIHLLIGAAIVAPAAWWSVALLTKVTTGIGLLAMPWRFALRAAGIAAAIALASFVIFPGLWVEWVELARAGVLAGGGQHPWTYFNFWPLPVRLAIAAGIALAARRWTWLMPVAVMMALPAVWLGSLAVLLAIPRALRRPSHTQRVPAPSRSPSR